MDKNAEMQSVPPLLGEASPATLLLNWARRLFACNPFYLISAACLLYGLYRLMIDPALQGAELRKLSTSFGSIQLYELLLVGTAIMLARRQIWYESTLLVTIENMFVLVPFILVTLATYLGNEVVWITCASATALAVLRFGSLKRFFRELNLPNRVLAIGLIVLLANLAAPFCFRSLHKDNVDLVAKYAPYVWLIALPLVIALANLLPRPTEWGGIAPRRSWLPLLMISLWTTTTGVHLYCLGYMYDLKWYPSLLAPVVWTAAWTMFNRSRDFVASPSTDLLTTLLVYTALVPLLGAWDGTSQIVLTLAGLNAVIYAAMYFSRRNNRVAYHLLLISMAMVVAAMPSHTYSRGECVAGAFLGYTILRAVLSRSPMLALGGALASGIALDNLLPEHLPHAALAVQVGLIFALVHSLSWVDREHGFAGGLRVILSAIWVLHSFGWLHSEAASTVWVVTLAVFVLACYFLTWLVSGRWGPIIVPATAALILLLIPGRWVSHFAFKVSAGLVAVLAAFVLFGIGTAIALLKNRWNEHKQQS